MPKKVSVRLRQRRGRVGEARRGGEPAGRRDTEPDKHGTASGRGAQAGEDREDRPEGGHRLDRPLRRPGARRRRGRQHRPREHRLRRPGARHPARAPGRHAADAFARPDLAPGEGGVVTEVPQRPQRLGMRLSLRARSGRKGAEPPAAPAVQDRLRQDRAGGVSGAGKEDVPRPAHGFLTSCGRFPRSAAGRARASRRGDPPSASPAARGCPRRRRSGAPPCPGTHCAIDPPREAPRGLPASGSA